MEEGLRSRQNEKLFADSLSGNGHEGHLSNLKSPLAPIDGLQKQIEQCRESVAVSCA